MSSALLKVEALRKWFPIRGGLLGRIRAYVKAVDGISFEVRRGETFGLVGESGSGKTTVAKCVLRLLEPTSGQILFDGREITTLKESELRPFRRKVQMIFQDPYASLDPRQTVKAPSWRPSRRPTPQSRPVRPAIGRWSLSRSWA